MVLEWPDPDPLPSCGLTGGLGAHRTRHPEETTFEFEAAGGGDIGRWLEGVDKLWFVLACLVPYVALELPGLW